MERITIPDEKIEGGWKRAVIDPEEVKKYTMTLYWTLKKYEDTGLTPDEINALRERDTVKEIRGIVDHSCFAFCPSCMQKITVWAKFCPECGQRLKLATAVQRPEWQERMLHTFLGGHT